MWSSSPFYYFPLFLCSISLRKPSYLSLLFSGTGLGFSSVRTIVVVVRAPRLLTGLLSCGWMPGGRFLYWGLGKGAAVSSARGLGKARKGARCLLVRAQKAALPGSQGCPLPLFPFPRQLGPSEVTCLAQPSFWPVDILTAQQCPQHPATAMVSQGAPTGASPGLVGAVELSG